MATSSSVPTIAQYIKKEFDNDDYYDVKEQQQQPAVYIIYRGSEEPKFVTGSFHTLVKFLKGYDTPYEFRKMVKFEKKKRMCNGDHITSSSSHVIWDLFNEDKTKFCVQLEHSGDKEEKGGSSSSDDGLSMGPNNSTFWVDRYTWPKDAIFTCVSRRDGVWDSVFESFEKEEEARNFLREIKQVIMNHGDGIGYYQFFEKQKEESRHKGRILTLSW